MIVPVNPNNANIKSVMQIKDLVFYELAHNIREGNHNEYLGTYSEQCREFLLSNNFVDNKCKYEFREFVNNEANIRVYLFKDYDTLNKYLVASNVLNKNKHLLDLIALPNDEVFDILVKIVEDTMRAIL